MKWYRTVAKVAVLACLILNTPSIVQAEIKEFSASATYTMSNYETLDIAQQRALREAERSALEQAGIYIESHTSVVNGKVVNDEVMAVASNVIKIKSKVFDKYFDEAKNLVTRASIVAVIDTDKVDKGLNRNDIKELTEQYDILKRAYIKQEKELLELKSKKDIPTDIEQAMKRIDNKFLASEKIQEINKLLYDFDEVTKNISLKYDGGSASDWFDSLGKKMIARDNAIKKAKRKRRNEIIEKCNDLIMLDPDNTDYYVMRASAYENYYKTLDAEEKDVEGEIFIKASLADYAKAISIDGKNDEIYLKRGLAYNRMGDTNKAIQDYNEAILINDKNWKAYKSRGYAYESIGQYRFAIRDYTYILDNLDWKNSYSHICLSAFFARANVYGKLNLWDNAVEDYSKIIEVINKNDDARLGTIEAREWRIEALFKSKRFSEVITGCNHLVTTNHDEIKGRIYYIRALTYSELGDKNKYVEDLSNAIKYGEKYGWSVKKYKEEYSWLLQ